MAKKDSIQFTQEHIMRVEAEQQVDNELFVTEQTADRNCPYCKHKVATLYREHHGATRLKCSRCGREALYPPVSLGVVN